jgi:hypothetical protein
MNGKQISIVLHVCLRQLLGLSGLLMAKRHLSARLRPILIVYHCIYSDPLRLQALQGPSDRELIILFASMRSSIR